jgi:hypothetical protein
MIVSHIYPIFRSNDVARQNPSSFCNRSFILGIGKVFLLILLFSSLRSAKDLKDLSGLDIVNMGHAYSYLFTFCNTPKSTSL